VPNLTKLFDLNKARTMECLIKFNDPDFKVQRPVGSRDEDLENVNPNDRERIERHANNEKRNWKWSLEK